MTPAFYSRSSGFQSIPGIGHSGGGFVVLLSPLSNSHVCILIPDRNLSNLLQIIVN
jgi:hypothetical protein